MPPLNRSSQPSSEETTHKTLDQRSSRALQRQKRRGATPRSAQIDGPSSTKPPQPKGGLSLGGLIVGICLVAVVVLALCFFVLAFTPLMAVKAVTAYGTSHLSSQDIINLAAIPEGSSLLMLDVEGIRSRLTQNPWVATVEVERSFNGTVTISVVERVPYALVTMNDQALAWYISQDGVWLEPSEVNASLTQSLFEAALNLSKQKELLLIADVPVTVNPSAGALCSDEPILSALTYQQTFHEELANQIAYYVANSESSLSCVLDSGLEISLGAPNDIESKETVILTLLEEYPNRLTYVNVRVPSKPTYRMVEGENVMEGTGVWEPSESEPLVQSPQESQDNESLEDSSNVYGLSE